MDISDNKAFEKSEEKFAIMEKLLKFTLNAYKITLLPGYAGNSEDKYKIFTSSQVYKPKMNVATLSLCIVNDK